MQKEDISCKNCFIKAIYKKSDASYKLEKIYDTIIENQELKIKTGYSKEFDCNM